MADLWKIVLTSGPTILGGAIVFAFSQLIQRLLLEPVHEQSKVIGEILFGHVYYARVYANPGSGSPEYLAAASDAFRRYASQLQATTHAIRCYGMFERVGLVPRRQKVDEVVATLIGISNSIHSGDGRENRTNADLVKRLLTLPAAPEAAR